MDSTISFKIQRPLTKGGRIFLRTALEERGLDASKKRLETISSIDLPDTKSGKALKRLLSDRFNY